MDLQWHCFRDEVQSIIAWVVKIRAEYSQDGNIKDLWLATLLSGLALEMTSKLEEELQQSCKSIDEFIKSSPELLYDWTASSIALVEFQGVKAESLSYPRAIKHLAKRYPEHKFKITGPLDRLMVQYINELVIELRLRASIWSSLISNASLDQISRSIQSATMYNSFRFRHAIAPHMLLSIVSEPGSDIEKPFYQVARLAKAWTE